MNCLTRWRKWIRPLVLVVYFLLLSVALPLMIIEFQVHSTKTHVQAWFIGGLFVIMAIPISLWGILQHLVHYNHPTLQRYIIRILWMVPIYALNAWFGLKFPHAAIYLDTMRECYEAYVIYNFMNFLLTYLNETVDNFAQHMALKDQIQFMFPLCWFRPWKMGRSIIEKCRHGVLQYTVVRTTITIIALICQICGKYKEGDFDVNSAWLYLAIINNISQAWAMYCLVLFYKATREELSGLKPISKFLCVKAVIFLSFWQGVIIAGFVKAGVIKDQPSLHIVKKDVATALQDFIICIEMFVAAIAHYYSFTHKPYVEEESSNCCEAFLSMWDVSDVRNDIVDHVRIVVGTQITRHSFRNTYERINERTPLLVENNFEDNVTIGSASDLSEKNNHPNHETNESLNNLVRFSDTESQTS